MDAAGSAAGAFIPLNVASGVLQSGKLLPFVVHLMYRHFHVEGQGILLELITGCVPRYHPNLIEINQAFIQMKKPSIISFAVSCDFKLEVSADISPLGKMFLFTRLCLPSQRV